MKAAGQTAGVLAVDTAKPNHFTAGRVQLLTTIAEEIGAFLENANLHETERLRIRASRTAVARSACRWRPAPPDALVEECTG